jgi:hypothetical protein
MNGQPDGLLLRICPFYPMLFNIPPFAIPVISSDSIIRMHSRVGKNLFDLTRMYYA